VRLQTQLGDSDGIIIGDSEYKGPSGNNRIKSECALLGPLGTLTIPIEQLFPERALSAAVLGLAAAQEFILPERVCLCVGFRMPAMTTPSMG
jgi:hypothetical protein